MTTQTPFVTAEDTQNVRTRSGALVWVMLETFSIVVDGKHLPVRFVITSASGYRAEVRACTFDGHPDGFVNCTRKIDARGMHSGMSVDKWCAHVRTHCHGYHLDRAQALRDQVMATYSA